MDEQKTYYEVLKVSQDALLIDIKKAFIELLKEYNPETFPELNNEISHKVILKINEAFTTLKNVHSRAIYDFELASLGKYQISNEEEIEKDNSITHKYKPNPSRYNYYNDTDFNRETEEKFIDWLTNYKNTYILYAKSYYKKLGVDAAEFLFQLIESFDNIIAYEQEYVLKRNKISL